MRDPDEQAESAYRAEPVTKAREAGVDRSRRRRAVLFWVLLTGGVLVVQLRLPNRIPALTQLELPLLATIYLGISSRDAVKGIFYGAVVGVIQDALSAQPLGLLGIVKTLAGYLAASMALRLDAENPPVRFVLVGLLFLFHQFLYWALSEGLLGYGVNLSLGLTLIGAVENAVAGVLVFAGLDKLREVV